MKRKERERKDNGSQRGDVTSRHVTRVRRRSAEGLGPGDPAGEAGVSLYAPARAMAPSISTSLQVKLLPFGRTWPWCGRPLPPSSSSSLHGQVSFRSASGRAQCVRSAAWFSLLALLTHPLPPALSLVLLLQIPAPAFSSQPPFPAVSVPGRFISAIHHSPDSEKSSEKSSPEVEIPGRVDRRQRNCSFVKYSSVVLKGKGSTKARTCPKAGRAPRRGRVGLPWLISRV